MSTALATPENPTLPTEKWYDITVSHIDNDLDEVHSKCFKFYGTLKALRKEGRKEMSLMRNAMRKKIRAHANIYEHPDITRIMKEWYTFKYEFKEI